MVMLTSWLFEGGGLGLKDKTKEKNLNIFSVVKN